MVTRAMKITMTMPTIKSNKKAPPVTTAAKQAIEWNALCKRVFKYPSSPADERFFRAGMQSWLQEPWHHEKPNFRQLLFNMTWVRNNGGEYLKYMFFNERAQRVYLDRDFEKWADGMRERIEKALQKLQQTNG
jgi:hypothetical protein